MERENPGLAKSLAELRELYRLDGKILKKTCAMRAAGFSVALILGMISAVFASVGMEKDWSDSTVGPALSGFLVGTSVGGAGLVSTYVRCDDLAFKLFNKYQDRALKELIIPREKEFIQVLQSVRNARDAKEVIKPKNRLTQLRKEVGEIRKVFWRWENDALIQKKIPGEVISFVLEFANKKSGVNEAQRKLFNLAVHQKRDDIKTLLKQGDIHRFDQAWVWPMVAQLYWYGDVRPLEQLVDLTKAQVKWDKWNKYWTEREKYARELGLIGAQDTFAKMSPEVRKWTVDEIDRLQLQQLRQKGK